MRVRKKFLAVLSCSTLLVITFLYYYGWIMVTMKPSVLVPEERLVSAVLVPEERLVSAVLVPAQVSEETLVSAVPGKREVDSVALNSPDQQYSEKQSLSLSTSRKITNVETAEEIVTTPHKKETISKDVIAGNDRKFIRLITTTHPENQSPSRETITNDNQKSPSRETITNDNQKSPSRETITNDNQKSPSRETITNDNQKFPSSQTITNDNQKLPSSQTITNDNQKLPSSLYTGERKEQVHASTVANRVIALSPANAIASRDTVAVKKRVEDRRMDKAVPPINKATSREEIPSTTTDQFLIKAGFHFPQPRAIKPLQEVLHSDWLKDLRATLHTMTSKQLTMVTSNLQYRDVLLNWLISAVIRGKIPLENILVISMDESVHRILQPKGVKSVLVTPRSFLTEAVRGMGTFPEVMMTRLGIIRLLNHWGFDVINYDTDAILLRDPQPIFDRLSKSGIIGTFGKFPQNLKQEWGITLCTAVLAVRSSQQTGKKNHQCVNVIFSSFILHVICIATHACMQNLKICPIHAMTCTYYQ